MRIPAKPVVRLSAVAVASFAVLGQSPQPAFAMPQAVASSGPAVSAHRPSGQQQPEKVQTSLEIVVRFKDDAHVSAIIATFWKDPEAARGRFNDYKQGYPELAQARLLRVTYSSELVLAFPFSGTAGRQEAARDLAARLSRLPSVVYAEPDYTVMTQGP